jgi:aspartyl-tRNA(Asn)/glutamyl-tRNA(Gln) amidotransferase subunit C
MESLKIVSRDRIERLAWLAKKELKEKEKEELTVQLNRILEAFKVLDELYLQGVEPTYLVIDVTNKLRENIEKPMIGQKSALKNASKVKDGFFVAPKIV